MQRRTFLRHLLAAPVAASTFLYGNPFRPGLSVAQAATGKTLVVIFQRGGCDGLNTVIPYGEDAYYNLRPSISIAPPNDVDPNSAIALGDGFFGLHPALQPLLSIYQQGDLAIMPAVHYPHASRSHFDSQDYLESGDPGRRLEDGWLNRYLAKSINASELPAVSFGSSLAHSLRGDIPVPSFTDLAGISLKNQDVLTSIRLAYQQHANNDEGNRTLLHKHGQTMFGNLDLVNDLDVNHYTPFNGAVYPDTEFGKQMRQISQLIKDRVGLEMVTVDTGSWDTHKAQGGAVGDQAVRHSNMAAGIAAMYSDLGPAMMENVLILTMTEFGRTAKENASGGTDHGNASTWFAIGGSVNGGIYGQWPGLNSDNLYKGRYLAHTVDFRDIFAEIIKEHLGNSNNLDQILPGYSNHQPVGFL